MSFGIDINGGIALRSYFLKVSEAQNIAQLLFVDPVLYRYMWLVFSFSGIKNERLFSGSQFFSHTRPL